MSVVSVFLPRTNARDIHLLPGLVSPRLDHLFFIEDTTGNKRADAPPAGVTVGFAIQALEVVPEDYGVTLNATTGEIEIASPLPAGTRLRSFIVHCDCTEGQNLFPLPVRVHVHEQITDMWLTPSFLHVRPGAENMRFSVLARFDDGVIGDITNWSPFLKPQAGDRTFVHRKGEAQPALRWSSPHTGDVLVDEDTGVLTAESAAANERITVERRPVPAPLSHLARAVVFGAPPWTTPVQLTHVQGKGFRAMNTTRNVLFLPDGFLNNPAEQRQFGVLVRGIVKRLTYHPQTSPFDLLSQQQTLNYFMAWVPSPDAGITVLNEQNLINVVGTQANGIPMEIPKPPPTNAAAWSLEELLYMVGPPTPVNDPAGSPLGTDAAGRLHEWRELRGDGVTNARVSGVYPDWLARDDRVLLNERDTAFHVAFSDRPRMDGGTTERSLTLNKLRLTEDDFDRFLRALTDDRSSAVGAVWASGGADHDLVVILCRSLRNGGSNQQRDRGGHYLALSLGDSSIHLVEEDIHGEGFDLIDDPLPADVSLDTWVTVAHELAHSWTLLDEYGGSGVIGVARADQLKDFANVQPRKTLLTANSLDADKIKWRWPRIEKAGALAAVPTDDSGVGTGPFRVQTLKNHGHQFGRGDIVRLRTRPLPTAITSDRLRINRMLADGDLIELVLLPGSALDRTKFPAGSVLIAPRRAPDNADGTPGDDLELMHPTVRARINTTHNPLNAAPGDPPNRPCPGVNLPTPTGATNFPAGAVPRPPRFSSWIVGLHENGDAFDCEVYHPTGVCIMRQLSFADVPTGRDRAYEFCPVCRYAIIDLLDPTRHRDVEARLAERYLK